MRFREHGINQPVVQLKDRAALIEYLQRQFAPWPDLDKIDLRKLKSEPYGVFTKTQGPGGWNGKYWLVSVEPYGVVGYCDEPV